MAEKTLTIDMGDGEIVETPLHEYLEIEESLSPGEMYSLNTLGVNESCAMGVHFGYVTFTRVS